MNEPTLDTIGLQIDALGASALRIKAERDELRDLLAGVCGLVQLISHRDDLPAALKESMLTNHRYLDAMAVL